MKYKVVGADGIYEGDTPVHVARQVLEQATFVELGGHVDVYVDGAHKDGKVFGGFVAVKDDVVVGEGTEEITDEEYIKGNQIAGECRSAELGVEFAIAEGYSSVCVHYDYLGIAYWIVDDPRFGKPWQTKKEYTKLYHSNMTGYMADIDITFKHVKGHSGDKWNEYVDKLVSALVGRE